MSVGLPVARKTPDKAKGPASESRRHGHLVRLGEDVVKAAKKVASLRDTNMAEYLTEILRPIVLKDLDAEAKKLMGGKG